MNININLRSITQTNFTYPIRVNHTTSTSEEIIKPRLLDPFYKSGALPSDFCLTPNGESVIYEVQKNLKIPVHFTLFEMLCFDLYVNMYAMNPHIQAVDASRLLSTFLSGWFTLNRQSPDVDKIQEFVAFINSLAISYVSSWVALQRTQNGLATQVKAVPNDNGLNIRALQASLGPRVQVMSQLLLNREAAVILLQRPLSDYEGLVPLPIRDSVSLSEALDRDAGFFKFAFISATHNNLKLSDSQQLRSTMKGFLSTDLEQRRSAIEKFDTWLGDREERLSRFVHLLFDSRDQNEFVKFGNDRLLQLKLNKKLDRLVSLTTKEDALLEQLFKEAPLSTELTLLDLLSFGVYLQLEKLRKRMPVDFHAKITALQNEVGAASFTLYVWCMRNSEQVVQTVGWDRKSDTLLAPVMCFQKLEDQITRLDEEVRSTSQEGAKRDELLYEITEQLRPIVAFWKRLFTNKHLYSISNMPVSNLEGCEKMEQPQEAIQSSLRSYVTFLANGYACSIHLHGILPESNLEPVFLFFLRPTVPSETECRGFLRGLVDRYITLAKLHIQASEELISASGGKLTSKKWVQLHTSHSKVPKRDHEFREFLCDRISLIQLHQFILTDLLYLLEEAFFPDSTITTRSSLYRLVVCISSLPQLNLQGNEEQKEWVKPILDPLVSYFQSPKFQPFYSYIQMHRIRLLSGFSYASTLLKIKPLEEDVTLFIKKTMKAFSLLPDQLRARVRAELSKLPLSELTSAKVVEYQKMFFDACIPIVSLIVILFDITGLLQLRHLIKRSEMIPPEVIAVLELEGIEEILLQVIQEKTKGSEAGQVVPAATQMSASAPPHPSEKAERVLKKLQDLQFFALMASEIKVVNT